MKKYFRLPENMSSQARDGFQIALAIAVAHFVAVPYYLYLVVGRTVDIAPFLVLILVSFTLGVLFVVGAGLSRGGRPIHGIILVLGILAVSYPPLALLVSGLGTVLGIALLFVGPMSAFQVLPRKSAWMMAVLTVGSGLATLLVDIFGSATRPSLPGLFIQLLATTVVIVVGYFIVNLAWRGSIRSKMMVVLIGLTLLAVGALAVYANTSTNKILRKGLEGELTQHIDGVSNGIANLFNEQINTLTALSLNDVLQQTVEDINNTYTGDAGAIQNTMETRDEQWRAADAANNNSAPLVREFLSNQAASELNEFQKSFPDHVEVFVTDVHGGLAGATNRTSDYYQADEAWWQAAYNNGQGAVYISEPEYDESSKVLAVLIAMPMRDQKTGALIGILRTTYQATALDPILGESIGKTGVTELFFPGETPAHFHAGQYALDETGTFKQLQTVADQEMVTMNFDGIPSVVAQSPVRTTGGNSPVDKLGWTVVYHQDQNEAFAPANEQIRGSFIVTAIILILAVLTATGNALLLSRPITQLTQTAKEVAAGNLNSRAQVTSTDEIGTLAITFNSMTSQLQETLQGLEQRVAARTKDLATVAEVGTVTATILESKRLLQTVVDLTKERFNLYHSHIYLLDEKGENLVLTAGAGEPGRIMVTEGRSIPLDREQSLVARAARERKGVTVNDVMQAPDFLPNPLLPNTHSELAVPMVIGGKVIGVFDIQSDQVGRFTDSDVNIQTTLAAQLATSIQNVRSFEQSRNQAEMESLVNTIGQKIQRATSIEETLQTAIRELGMAISAKRVCVNISAAKNGSAN
jgi:putative methionine-R-sulfoxide reductase with GAF domain